MTDSLSNKKLVLQAVNALRELNVKHLNSTEKKSLLEDETKCSIYLQVTLKKIPRNKCIKMIKVHLPHSLVKDTSEICLITGDLDKNNHKAEIEPDILHYKELLEKNGITNISEVMTLRQLRTEYKPYEAKQKLLAAFDVFLVDNKISECLPRILGKHFFRKRKFPIQINLHTVNLKRQIENALSAKVFYLTGHGNSCSCDIAYLDMKDSEILENVITVVQSLSEKLPGSLNNVMGMYLKTSKSVAIPIYMSYEKPDNVCVNDDKSKNEFCIDELSTAPNVKVKVYKDGMVKTVRSRDDRKFPKEEVVELSSQSCSESSDTESKEELKIKNKSSKVKSESSTSLDIPSSEELAVNKAKGKQKIKKKRSLSVQDAYDGNKESMKSKRKKIGKKCKLPISDSQSDKEPDSIKGKESLKKNKDSCSDDQIGNKESKKSKEKNENKCESPISDSLSDNETDSIKEKEILKENEDSNLQFEKQVKVKNLKKRKHNIDVQLCAPDSQSDCKPSMIKRKSLKKKGNKKVSTVS